MFSPSLVKIRMAHYGHSLIKIIILGFVERVNNLFSSTPSIHKHMFPDQSSECLVSLQTGSN